MTGIDFYYSSDLKENKKNIRILLITLKLHNFEPIENTIYGNSDFSIVAKKKKKKRICHKYEM